MDLHGNGFLEELLAMGKGAWEGLQSSEMSGGFCFQENLNQAFTSSSSFGNLEQGQQSFTPAFNEASYPFNEGFFVGGMEPSCKKKATNPLLPCQEDCISSIDDEEIGLLCENIYNPENPPNIEDIEMASSPKITPLNVVERKNKSRRLEGEPSKNLMAERRRRKRLNDRLSLLRSVVPKISKMDRASIVGDTVDYMKELLEKINKLQDDANPSSIQVNETSIAREFNPNIEALAKNTSKFDVERRKLDTKIEICCTPKPGLLLSTVDTLEALGLEIEQGVISCFNCFRMQASCSEDLNQRAGLSSEDIKQELLRNAGYGSGYI